MRYSSLKILLPAFIAFMACKGSLDVDLKGKLCDEEHRCASGYVCDRSTNHCVRQGALTSSGVACSEGQTVCGGRCVNLKTAPLNCGGCGAECTAPAGGEPVCSDGACNFVCGDGLERCGAACVSPGDDAKGTRRVLHPPGREDRCSYGS